MKYRKLPVVIDAIQWKGTDESYEELEKLIETKEKELKYFIF